MKTRTAKPETMTAEEFRARRLAYADKHGLKVIAYEGDEWVVIAVGARESDLTYCHLTSTTRFRSERLGPNPVSIATWVKL